MYTEPYDDIKELFDGIIKETTLQSYINIKVVGNTKLKDIGKVKKANPLMKYMTKQDVVIEINEEVFTQLEDEQKEMKAKELVAPIKVNERTGKITIDKPDVQTFSGLLRKYGYEKYERMNESIKAAFQQLEEQKEEEKQNK